MRSKMAELRQVALIQMGSPVPGPSREAGHAFFKVAMPPMARARAAQLPGARARAAPATTPCLI